MNEVLSQLHARKSVRAFLDRPISPEARRAILEAACAAPTAGNQQLYTILDITDQAVKDTLADTCDHQPFIAQAPLVLLFCADCQKWYDAFAAGGCSPRRPGPGDPVAGPVRRQYRRPERRHRRMEPGHRLLLHRRHSGAGGDPPDPAPPGRSTCAPPPCWCLATPHSNSRSGKSPAAAPWSTSSTRTPTAAWSRPSWRLCWPTTPEPALRCVAGRLLQAQVQLRFLPRDVPLHGRVPQALSAVKTPAPGFGWKPGAGLHFPACFGKMEPGTSQPGGEMLMSPADEAWVKELYEANALKLYKVAFRRLGDKDEAENVVQEAFLLLLARFDTVRVHPNPSGWLMKVVQNLIRHSMDRNQKQSSHEISIEEQITQISAPPKQFFSLRDILPPGLTQREQDLLVWFYEEGLSYEEISARLKIPILTCRTQMFRAKQHYKKLAEKETDFSELM